MQIISTKLMHFLYKLRCLNIFLQLFPLPPVQQAEVGRGGVSLDLLRIYIFITIFALSSNYCVQAGPEAGPEDNYDIQVFLTKEQALKQVFPDSDEIVYDKVVLTEEERKQLQNRLRRKIYEDRFIVYIGLKAGKVRGYAIITEEIGKFHPYTFIVAANRKGKISNIAVLVYRESRGAEIKHKRFLRQFKGKSLKSPIRINKDIINITGATMSVVTMCSGVRKVLAVIDAFYLSGKRTDKIASMEKVVYGGEEVERPEELNLYKKTILSMGTAFEVSAYASLQSTADKVFNDIFKEMARLDHLMSNYKGDSELSKVNTNAPTGPVQCNEELAYIIEQALEYSVITDGAFDITVGPLMRKWGFFKGEGRIPDKGEIESVLKTISYKNILIKEEIRKSILKGEQIVKTIAFSNPGTQIDLGGIGKGHAVDNAVKIIRRYKIKSALINFAGNIHALGKPPERGSWAIGLQHPRDHGSILGTFNVTDKAISTSGDYEKFFIINGERHSHIIDPRTGYPVKGIVSVTIVADSATRADALSTGVFVLGLEKGMELIEKLPDVEGVIIYEDNDSELHIKTSYGMKKIFKSSIERSRKGANSDVIIKGR